MMPPVIWTSSVGSYALYAIEDGWMWRDPAEHLPGSDSGYWARHPERLVNGRLRVSLGCFLLTDGSRTVLIDTGVGAPTPHTEGGLLPGALAFIGVDPAEVDHVVHTNLDVDHCGGDVTSLGAPRFPNARVSIHRGELEARAGEPHVVRILEGLGDRVAPFDGPGELATGITAVETPGHTPGHVAVSVMSGGSRLLIAGDALHDPAQIEHPEWGGPGAQDPDAGARSRSALLDLVSGTGTVLAAGHFPRPGIGYVELLASTHIFTPGITMQLA